MFLWCLLGFGDHQRVAEEEQVSVLSLHPRLQLSVSVEEKRPVGAGQEGLDQRTGLGTHGNEERLPQTQSTDAFYLHSVVSANENQVLVSFTTEGGYFFFTFPVHMFKDYN